MTLFIFVEIALDKKCYRVWKVTAPNEQQARLALRGGDWARALVATKKTKSIQITCKTSLLRELEDYKYFCRKLGTLANTVDDQILQAMAIPPGVSEEAAKAWIRGGPRPLPLQSAE